MPAANYTTEFYEANWRGSLRSAEEVIPVVLEFIQPQRVVELGCGVGAWLSVLKRHGAAEVIGVDGDYVNREKMFIPAEEFIVHNLEKPFRIGRSFDLAISLEVAEHLPQSSADAFVRSLTTLAPVVLFSAAIPFQGGTHHVNEQWPDFWADIFRAQGFETIDCLRRRLWENERVEWWYAQNVLIYARNDFLAENAALHEAFERTCLSQLRLVHPKKYLAAVDPAFLGFRHLLPTARTVTLNALRRRARRSVSFLRDRVG
ncbi:MAG: class I SAM-dependent methyltransferase [Terriglobia bacterium]